MKEEKKETSEVIRKLKESEVKYRNLIESLPTIIWEADLTSKITYLNPAGLKKLGYTQEDFKKGLSALQFIAPEDRKRAQRDKRKLFVGKEENTQEYKLIKKDGTLIYVRENSRLIYKKGKLFGALSVIHDITERKKSLITSMKDGLAILKESEEKYKNERDNLINILNSIEDGVYIVNQQNDIEYVNPVLIKEFGPFEGKKCYNYFHDREEACPWCKNTDVIKGKTVRWEWYFFKNQKTYDLIDTPLKNPDGRISKLEIFRDITEHKKIERELKESEEKYRIFLQNFQGIAYLAEQSNFKSFFIHGNVEEITGYSKMDFINEKITWDKIAHPDDLPKIIQEGEKKISNPKYISNIIYRILHKNGKIKWVNDINQTLYDPSGEISFIQGSIYDITERKIAEQKLKESEERYREAYNLVNFYKDLFAHDMNNILQSVLSTAEYHSIFRNDPKKLKDFGDISELIKMHVGRGTSLISKVRTLSKLEETEINLIPIVVNDILSKSVENTKNSFYEKKINLQIVGLSKNLKIIGDELLIDVFDNLLNNAIKFSDDNKDIIVDIIISEIQADDVNYIKFEFKDYGIGIPNDRKEILFKELFERYTSKRGMGIGLSLVKKIVDKYGGKIWVEDRIKGNYKEGSNFVMLLKEAH